MRDLKLAESDYAFMETIWENEPVGSMALVKLCEAKLGWKKSTTFTMIRKMCDKGMAKNENAVVSSLVTKEEVEAYRSNHIVSSTFHGSLPRFLAAFLGNKSLSKEEADELRELIDKHED